MEHERSQFGCRVLHALVPSIRLKQSSFPASFFSIAHALLVASYFFLSLFFPFASSLGIIHVLIVSIPPLDDDVLLQSYRFPR